MRDLPPTSWKQREPIYEDVIQLIYPGFLTHQVYVRGVCINLRSLGPGDGVLLQSRVNKWEDWRSWALATATWMVDGHNLLPEQHAVPRLRKMYLSFPKGTRNLLFSILQGLLLRRDRAVELTEAFCLEELSIYMWRTGGGRSFMSNLGIDGVQGLGLNHVQQMWMAYHELDDLRTEFENAWSCAKLTTSSMAPDGIKKIEAQEANKKREEAARKQLLLDGSYYWAVGRLADRSALNQKRKEQGIILPLKSHEELEEEMRTWVTGEQDIHDQVVAEFKARMRAKHEEAKQRQAQRRAALEEALEMESIKAVPLVGYTASQVQQMLGGTSSGTRMVYDQSSHARLRTKIESEVVPGDIRVQGRRLVAPQIDLDEDGDTLTLQDRVSRRQVLYRSGEKK